MVQGEEKFYVRTPSGDKITFGGSGSGLNQRRPVLFAALCSQLGRLPVTRHPEVVPVEVAAAGKPEVATYLCSVHRPYYVPDGHWKPLLVADALGVAEDTVTTYCRRVTQNANPIPVGEW